MEQVERGGDGDEGAVGGTGVEPHGKLEGEGVQLLGEVRVAGVQPQGGLLGEVHPNIEEQRGFERILDFDDM